MINKKFFNPSFSDLKILVLIVIVFSELSFTQIEKNKNLSFTKPNILGEIKPHINSDIISKLQKSKASSNLRLDSLFIEDYYGCRLVFHYDKSGRLEYYINSVNHNNEWVPSDSVSYSYDSLGRITSELTTSISNGLVAPNFVLEHTYDSKGNEINSLSKYCSNGQWENWLQHITIYNDLISDTNYSLIWENNSWVNNSKLINKYSSEGLRETTFLLEWVDSNWVDFARWYLEYENNQYKTVLMQKYENNIWNDFLLSTFEYSNVTPQKIHLYETWKDSNWVKAGRTLYSFNNDNQITSIVNESWLVDAWCPDFNLLQYENSAGFEVNYLGISLKAYYSNPSNVKKEGNSPSSFTLSQNYPNPFNPSTNIRYSVQEPGFVSLKVFNALGQEVAVLVNEEKSFGSYEVTFNASDLPSGIYFYKLTSGKFSETKKMMFVK